jgi:hypothetical protein
MQHARQPSRQPDAPARRRPRPAGEHDAQQAVSPARELQDALRTAYVVGVPTIPPEPAVRAWPGWAKLAVLAGGALLSWGAVVGVARLLLDV